MSSTAQTRPAADQVAPARRPRLRFVALTGLVAALVAMAATAVGAALARSVGVDFRIPDGGEQVPVAGVAVVTGFFALVGVVIALGLRWWSRRPAVRFLQSTAVLTAASMVPPFLSGGSAGTVTALVALHLVAAAVMVPPLTRSLRAA